MNTHKSKYLIKSTAALSVAIVTGLCISISISSCGGSTNSSKSFSIKGIKNILNYNYKKYGHTMDGLDYTGTAWSAHRAATTATDTDMIKDINRQLTPGILFNSFVVFMKSIAQDCAEVFPSANMNISGVIEEAFVEQDVKYWDMNLSAVVTGINMDGLTITEFEIETLEPVPCYYATYEVEDYISSPVFRVGIPDTDCMNIISFGDSSDTDSWGMLVSPYDLGSTILPDIWGINFVGVTPKNSGGNTEGAVIDLGSPTDGYTGFPGTVIVTGSDGHVFFSGIPQIDADDPTKWFAPFEGLDRADPAAIVHITPDSYHTIKLNDKQINISYAG